MFISLENRIYFIYFCRLSSAAHFLFFLMIYYIIMYKQNQYLIHNRHKSNDSVVNQWRMALPSLPVSCLFCTNHKAQQSVKEKPKPREGEGRIG
jgi:hypothetical protein